MREAGPGQLTGFHHPAPRSRLSPLGSIPQAHHFDVGPAAQYLEEFSHPGCDVDACQGTATLGLDAEAVEKRRIEQVDELVVGSDHPPVLLDDGVQVGEDLAVVCVPGSGRLAGHAVEDMNARHPRE